MKELVFKKATLQHAPELKNISRRVISTNYAPFLGVAATAEFIESGMADNEIDNGIGNCTVAFCGKQAVGFAVTNKDILHIIMIDVPFQKSGYGAALLTYVEKALFSVYGTIYLQTFEDNTAAVNFYLKSGWQVTEKQEIPEMGKAMLLFKKVKTSF